MCHCHYTGPMSWLDSSTDKVKLYGLVSFGDGCAKPGKPGVYALVSKVQDWIKEVTGDCNSETCNKGWVLHFPPFSSIMEPFCLF